MKVLQFTYPLPYYGSVGLFLNFYYDSTIINICIYLFIFSEVTANICFSSGLLYTLKNFKKLLLAGP
jgi:hypothetical protein